MEKKIPHDRRIANVSGKDSKNYCNYNCPYCKQQLNPSQPRMNCPNCAREIILWDLLNHV